MTHFEKEATVIDATERFAAPRVSRNRATLGLGECAILRIYGNGDSDNPTPEARRARATLLSAMLADESNGLSAEKRAQVRAMLGEMI